MTDDEAIEACNRRQQVLHNGRPYYIVEADKVYDHHSPFYWGFGLLAADSTGHRIHTYARYMDKMEKKIFYRVYKSSKTGAWGTNLDATPNVYIARADAEAEAKDFARANPSYNYLVLKAVSWAETTNVTLTSLD